MKFPMIQADDRGETHFGVHDIPERELAVGPPPNPKGQMSEPEYVVGVRNRHSDLDRRVPLAKLGEDVREEVLIGDGADGEE